MKVYSSIFAGVLLLSAGFILPTLARALALAPASSTANEAQVQAYATEEALSDTQVKNVQLATTSVSITYPVTARLFGIFPTMLHGQFSVASNGAVKIIYPWYSFFFSTEQAELQTKLDALGKLVGAFSTSTLTVTQQLTLLTLLHATLQSSLGGTTTATSSVQ